MTTRKFLHSTKLQLFCLLIVAVSLNLNTLFNEFAVDDEEVLTQNSLVKQGIKGIPKILTTDLLYGTPDAENSLVQPRYRPLSLVIFAVEYQIFGLNPFVSHLINILLFALLIALLFKLLQKLFHKYSHYLAFITCLVFAVHPIHTEVIANIKSRDEILTFIFLISSLFYFIRHSEKPSTKALITALLFFFLALLTRESAVTFIMVIPLVLYYFFKQPVKKALLSAVPALVVLIGYVSLRIIVVGVGHPAASSIMDSPFLYATGSQAFATKVFILFKYISLLFFPYPLSCDYGFNQIPYVDILSIPFLLSFLLLIGLLVYAIVFFRKKSVLSFSIFYFIITISLASNFIIDIGTPLSERLLFQPSLAFCILIAIFYVFVIRHFALVANIVLLLILIPFSIKTISRNAEWKNNQTLYFTDVISAPNSVRTNLYAAINHLLKANNESSNDAKMQDLRRAVYYGEQASAIFHNYPDIYKTLGYAYFGLQDYLNAADNWLLESKFNPSDKAAQARIIMLSNVLFDKANKFYALHNIPEAIKYYQKSVDLNINNVEAWYKLGGNYFLMNDTKNGIEAWQNVISLAPNHALNKEEFSK